MRSGYSRRRFVAAASSVGASLGLAQACKANAALRTAGAARFDLDRFIEDVRGANAGSERQRAVEEVLRRAVSEPRAVLAALGEPEKAGIHTIHRSADLTILNVVWAPLMVLMPHNHLMWASIGIYGGREDNVIWERHGDVIEATGAASLSDREVFGLGREAIHSVTNPIRRLTGAIHIYGGDFFAVPRSEWDPDSLREQPFDLERAMRLFREANERFKASGS